MLVTTSSHVTISHVDSGMEPGADLGPLITKDAKQRVLRLIESGVKEGASLLLDGRGLVVKGYENGNFVGPTILHDVQVGSSPSGLVSNVHHRKHYFQSNGSMRPTLALLCAKPVTKILLVVHMMVKLYVDGVKVLHQLIFNLSTPETL
jgi:Aldehyde dehydrogenase family